MRRNAAAPDHRRGNRLRTWTALAALGVVGAVAAWVFVPVALSQEIDPGGGSILCYAKYNWPQGGPTIEHGVDYLPPSHTSYSGWRYYPVQSGYSNVFVGSRLDANWNETWRGSWMSEPYGGGPVWHYSAVNSTDVYRFTQISTYGAGFKYSMEQWARSAC